MHVRDESIDLVRVGRVDPVLVGRVVGLLGGPIGLIVGDAVGRKLSARRSGSEPVERIPLGQIVAVTVDRRPWGGRIRIGAGGSGGKVLRWSRRDVNGNEVAGLLHSVVGRRFSLHPYGNGLRVAHRATMLALLLGVVAMIAVPIKMIAFPPPPKGADFPAAARDALHRACPVWRESPLSGPQLAATVQRIRPDVERAVVATAALNPMIPALNAIEEFSTKGPHEASLAQAAQFSESVDLVDASCAHVGA